jgi:hypothetical protein
MHKIESFALSSGSKISKPFINELYFPLVEEKYICISKSSKFPSEHYDFFDDVAFHINPYLEKNNIKLIQIGAASDLPIYYTKNFNFLNINQAAYVIKNSLMYVGNLNIYSNIASMFNKKMVCPSRVNYIESIRPYWSKKSECKIIQSKRKNFKPVLAPQESPKTINDVYPEAIGKAILDSLKIKNNLNKLKTSHIGSSYSSKAIEIIPNFIPDASLPLEGILNVRADKHFDIQNLIKIAQTKKINIVTDQVIDINILKPVSENIESISFYINGETRPEEVEYLSRLGKPINLLAKNLKNLKDIRVKFLDYDITEVKELSINDSNVKKISKNTMFLSRKTVLSDGQVFNGTLSQSEKQNNTAVKDCPEFWEDLDFVRIYEESP